LNSKLQFLPGYVTQLHGRKIKGQGHNVTSRILVKLQ